MRKTYNALLSILNACINFVFPKTCIACNKGLYTNEQNICITCIGNLPYTNSHENKENFIFQKLYNLTGAKEAYSFLYFVKNGLSQNILHNIKYHNQSQAAYYFGQWYGTKLQMILKNVDVIIPVPLHPQKFSLRGYNQSEEFAKGINEILNKKVDDKFLIKTRSTQSQTQKNKQSRYQNLKDGFKINPNSKNYNNKCVLLVDDVITTGATIESCANTIMQHDNSIQLYIVSLAVVDY